ncbi:transmembrane protease serine 9-like [Paramacrobiotus metropolitanus]|uniref:transmembrane protease serine 9-like n=1 Tax=Paramacrobiotus metropolitanus TaxID=2943436 RepID=UPI002445FDB4|nr:transmembrane protease serine 9-like [Paramacrobiotus metropolitanus]
MWNSALCILWCYAVVGCFGGPLIPDDYGTESTGSTMSAYDMEFVDVGPATMSAGNTGTGSSLVPVDYPDGAPKSSLFSADYTDTPSSSPVPPSTYQGKAADDYPDLTQSAAVPGDYDTPVMTHAGAKAPLIPVDYEELGFGQETMIINGQTVPDNEFTFIVSLRNGGRHICGGSVLDVPDRKSIITAAHCVHSNGEATPASQLSVAVGIRRLSTVSTANVIQVSQVIVHPQWSENDILNDLAVLRLERAVADTGTIKVSSVKLPPPNREPDAGRPLEAAGWGKTTQGLKHGTASDILLKATLKVVERKVCTQKLGRPAHNPIPDSQICTENEQAGTCKGDSGGPLINRRPDGDYLVGLTSYGMPGCNLGTADAFTKVSYFSNWIDSVAKGNGQAPAPAPGGSGGIAPSPIGGPAPSPIGGPAGPGVVVPPSPVPGPPGCSSCGGGWGLIAVVIVLPNAPTGSCQQRAGMGLMCGGRGTPSGGTRCRFIGHSIRCSSRGFMGVYSTGEEAQCFNYEGRRYCPKSALPASTAAPKPAPNTDYDQYS